MPACLLGDGDPTGVSHEPECPSEERQLLIGGTTDEAFLGMSPAQQQAIVELVDESGSSDAFCSGTFVTPRWVLSAAHCLQIPSVAVRVRGAPGSPVTLSVARTEPHPSLDLVLLEIDFEASDTFADVLDLGVLPLPAGATDPTLERGHVVELAGYGTTESATTNELRFLVESIVEVHETSIRVDGFGVTGACTGDSGGPLLARRSDGGIVVLGVLSAGSASCVDKDRYIRTHAALDWLEDVAGAYTTAEHGCGALDAEGRCFYGTATWCEDGSVTAVPCTEPGRRCGWDTAARGFRCVAPGTDPCAGVDRVGSCRLGAAMTCAAGSLLVEACGPCGACLTDGRTGRPYCSSEAP